MVGVVVHTGDRRVSLGDRLVSEVPQAAAVGRAMAIRAELAAARGDTETARRWARNVLALWDGASRSLEPVMTRMQSVAGVPKPTR